MVERSYTRSAQKRVTTLGPQTSEADPWLTRCEYSFGPPARAGLSTLNPHFCMKRNLVISWSGRVEIKYNYDEVAFLLGSWRWLAPCPLFLFIVTIYSSPLARKSNYALVFLICFVVLSSQCGAFGTSGGRVGKKMRETM